MQKLRGCSSWSCFVARVGGCEVNELVLFVRGNLINNKLLRFLRLMFFYFELFNDIFIYFLITKMGF